jgi:hypothetical protein
VLPPGLEPEVEQVGSNLRWTTQRFVAEVVALGGGFPPERGGAEPCLPEFGVEAGMARSGTSADWLELAAGEDSFLLSFSSPPASLGLGLGQALEVSYAVLDDLLLDSEPWTRSLVVRDSAGALRIWLATSASVEGLNDAAPAEVRLSAGAAQCRIERGCPTYVQQVLGVELESARLALTQGELAALPGWRVLAGQSEALVDSASCKLEGPYRSASIGVWRVFD